MRKAANAAWRKSSRKDCLISIAYQYSQPVEAAAIRKGRFAEIFAHCR
jgi:hypothetical protein